MHHCTRCEYPARSAGLCQDCRERDRASGWTTYHVGDLPDEPYNGPEDHGWGAAGPEHDPR